MNPINTAIQHPSIAYPLHPTGYIHNWLIAGPQAIPVDNLERFAGADFKPQIACYYQSPNHLITQLPAEQTVLQTNDEHGATKLTWRAVQCRDDHFVTLSAFYPTCHYLRAWAYAEIDMPTAAPANFLLTTNGPAEVWLNGEQVHNHLHFHHQIAPRVPFVGQLQAGRNQILVCFSAVAVRECPYTMALQVTGIDAAVCKVILPTTLAVERRQKLERLFNAAYLDKEVYHGQDEIRIRWPEDLAENGEITIRLQTQTPMGRGRIYAEGHPTIKAGANLRLGRANERLDGAYYLTLMPPLEEYYTHGMRIERHIPLRITNSKFAEFPYGAPDQRRREALTDAARREVNVYSEIAKITLGQWEKVKWNVFEQTIENINQRADCSDFYLIGLIGLLARHGDNPHFAASVKARLEACVLNFKYWMDEPGQDAMCYWSENHQILFHTCELLAGQLFPDANFPNVNQNGAWHQKRGEERALSWLRKRALGGFREWDSNVYFEHDVLALSHLVDLAANGEVAEMAAIILDKLCFTLALNSHKGVFGSSHGRSYALYLKSGRLELTSGLSRLLWGAGAFNDHILGTVGLACTQSYELPEIITQIGGNLFEEIWSRERHAGELEAWCDLDVGPWEVNKVTYKTPDYMLCSAQDYRPGLPGYQQHIWQATFGPDAVVFVTHPPCLSEDGSHRPNAWHGNAILPRVAQWKDMLVAIHNLPSDDWMGFTHAYFPTACFDAYTLRDGWAFARKGDGYLALTAAGGLQLITQGDSAYRELRSYSLQNVWLCQMGRAALDGSFDEFQTRVLSLEIRFEKLSVHATTLRGDSIDFGWQGPLLRNGTEEAISGFKHYDNPFSVTELGAEQMDIQFGDQLMRLDFSILPIRENSD